MQNAFRSKRGAAFFLLSPTAAAKGIVLGCPRGRAYAILFSTLVGCDIQWSVSNNGEKGNSAELHGKTPVKKIAFGIKSSGQASAQAHDTLWLRRATAD